MIFLISGTITFSHSIGKKNEASVPVFYADWTSVPVPRTSSLRGLDVGFIPLLPKELPYMANNDEYTDEYNDEYLCRDFFVGFNFWSRLSFQISEFRVHCITYVALTNKMADTCVRLRQSRVQARPVRFGQDDCTMYIAYIAYVVWRGLRLLTTWRKSFVSYASARVSMSKICNRYLAKIDIWYNNNLWCRRL